MTTAVNSQQIKLGYQRVPSHHRPDEARLTSFQDTVESVQYSCRFIWLTSWKICRDVPSFVGITQMPWDMAGHEPVSLRPIAVVCCLPCQNTAEMTCSLGSLQRHSWELFCIHGSQTRGPVTMIPARVLWLGVHPLLCQVSLAFNANAWPI